MVNISVCQSVFRRPALFYYVWQDLPGVVQIWSELVIEGQIRSDWVRLGQFISSWGNWGRFRYCPEGSGSVRKGQVGLVGVFRFRDTH
jgi:hypothetical protein